ncbi:MAG TPA: hypothetical protein DEB39_16670, partial [Planctomycetaceae bacterium]|nr:hypothetical protein [Planctomycetaceae bacterium]
MNGNSRQTPRHGSTAPEGKAAGRTARKDRHAYGFVFSSWFGSLVFHALILLLLFFFVSVRGNPDSPPGERLNNAGIVFKQDGEEGRVYSDSDGNTHTESPAAATPSMRDMFEERFSEQAIADSLPETAIGVSSPRGQPGIGNVTSLNTGAGLTGSDRAGTGAGPGGGKTKVRFWGTEGTAQRFVFVIDRSSSMLEDGGRPFREAKAELRRAVDSLTPENRFNVVFYSDTMSAIFGEVLKAADDINKTAAKRIIDGTLPAGGTDHEAPLIRALRMKPEVIFFLTDGDEKDALSAAALDRIQRAS